RPRTAGSCGWRGRRRSGSTGRRQPFDDRGGGAKDGPLVGAEVAEVLDEPHLTATARLDDELAGCRREREQHLAAVGGVRRAGDQAGLLEVADHARHGRRLDLLEGRELAGRRGAVAVEGRERRQLGEREAVLGALLA